MGKKIGLSVCYDTKNYGSQLQVLATVRKIEQLGFDTEIIRYKKKITPMFVKQTLPRFFNPYFIKNKMEINKRKNSLKKHPDIEKKVAIRDRRFVKFVEENYQNLSKPYYGWENLVSGVKDKYDGFLCGSDQLWLPSNLGSHFYTLEYAPDNKPKIAYATSFGVSEIPSFQKKRTANYLNRFSSLSTREVSGTKIIKSLTNKDVPVVLDPTLLFSEDEWLNIMPNKEVVSEKYIFCFLLGNNESHRLISEELKKATGLKIVTIPFLNNYVPIDETFGDVHLYDVDASDFVNLIRNAEYVITDSFHGSVFSILNHKKFIVLNRFAEGSDSRNSRIDSLCSILNLEKRRFSKNIHDEMIQPIDYESVDKKLLELREKSIDYLKNALNKI